MWRPRAQLSLIPGLAADLGPAHCSLWTPQPGHGQGLGLFSQGSRCGILIFPPSGRPWPALGPTPSGCLPSAAEPLKLAKAFPVPGRVRLTGHWASTLPHCCWQARFGSGRSLGRQWVWGPSFQLREWSWGGGRAWLSLPCRGWSCTAYGTESSSRRL